MAFAIIKTGGRQYRVAEGDTIDVDLLATEAGKQIVLSDVLLHADGETVTHGAPIEGARVTAQVVEQRKDKKIIAYKFKRRKGYHRTRNERNGGSFQAFCLVCLCRCPVRQKAGTSCISWERSILAQWPCHC